MSLTSFLYDSRDGKYSFIEDGVETSLFYINDSGQIIGMATNTTAQVRFPFLFMDGVVYNLYGLMVSDPTLTEVIPIAINNKGQIIANTYQGPILLTPISQDDED